MTNTFIFDENVIQIGLNANESNPSSIETVLILEVLRNPHRIALSIEIYNEKYASKLSVLQREFPSLAKLFSQALWDAEKAVLVEDVGVLPYEIEIQIRDAPDLPFVRLAVKVDDGCILATTDQALREDVTRLNLPLQYNFRILPPDRALRFAGPEES